MEREHPTRTRGAAPEHRAAALPPPPDALATAQAAAARADAVPRREAVIPVTVRSTSAGAGGIVSAAATPDTLVSEVFDRACRELGIADREHYALVANGEVLGGEGRSVGEVAGERPGELVMRLVRKPEAGRAAAIRGRSACRS